MTKTTKLTGEGSFVAKARENVRMIKDLVDELLKEWLLGEEFISWKTNSFHLDEFGNLLVEGVLDTEADHVLGNTHITYYGVTLVISCNDRENRASWRFEMKCESQFYSVKDGKTAGETGSNWNDDFAPDLTCYYDEGKKYYQRISELIYNLI